MGIFFFSFFSLLLEMQKFRKSRSFSGSLLAVVSARELQKGSLLLQHVFPVSVQNQCRQKLLPLRL